MVNIDLAGVLGIKLTWLNILRKWRAIINGGKKLFIFTATKNFILHQEIDSIMKYLPKLEHDTKISSQKPQILAANGCREFRVRDEAKFKFISAHSTSWARFNYSSFHFRPPQTFSLLLTASFVTDTIKNFFNQLQQFFFIKGWFGSSGSSCYSFFSIVSNWK